MPTPKSGTVTEDLAKTITEVKGGRVEFKVDKTANLHVQVGKTSFTQEHLVENASAAVSAVLKAKPDTIRGPFVLSASVSATMSPSVKLDVKELAKLA